MSAVKNLCKNGIVLENGQMAYSGNIENAVDYYLENSIDDIVSHTIVSKRNRNRQECDQLRDVEMLEVRLLNDYPDSIATDEPIDIELTMRRNTDKKKECQYSVVITDVSDTKILNIVSKLEKIPQDKDTYKVKIRIVQHGLPRGRYKINIAVGLKDFGFALSNYDVAFDLLSFEIKYISKHNQKEYASWERSWGIILHNQECIETEVIE